MGGLSAGRRSADRPRTHHHTVPSYVSPGPRQHVCLNVSLTWLPAKANCATSGVNLGFNDDMKKNVPEPLETVSSCGITDSGNYDSRV